MSGGATLSKRGIIVVTTLIRSGYLDLGLNVI